MPALFERVHQCFCTARGVRPGKKSDISSHFLPSCANFFSSIRSSAALQSVPGLAGLEGAEKRMCFNKVPKPNPLSSFAKVGLTWLSQTCLQAAEHTRAMQTAYQNTFMEAQQKACTQQILCCCMRTLDLACWPSGRPRESRHLGGNSRPAQAKQDVSEPMPTWNDARVHRGLLPGRLVSSLSSRGCLGRCSSPSRQQTYLGEVAGKGRADSARSAHTPTSVQPSLGVAAGFRYSLPRSALHYLFTVDYQIWSEVSLLPGCSPRRIGSVRRHDHSASDAS